jgi:hypothetical protein
MTAVVSADIPFAVQYRKVGRVICLGKVFRQPDGTLAFGTPYASRPFSTPSLPLVVYRFLTDLGVKDWIIRLDQRQKAYRIRLDAVGRLGSLTEDGELSVPLHFFEPIPFPHWPYAARTVLVPLMPDCKTTAKGGTPGHQPNGGCHDDHCCYPTSSR